MTAAVEVGRPEHDDPEPSTIEPAEGAEPGPFSHLTDRELAEATADVLNTVSAQLAWLIDKVVQAEAMVAGLASDPKFRMLMPKIGG